jgi:DNA-binding IclR family transcriptional regulator
MIRLRLSRKSATAEVFDQMGERFRAKIDGAKLAQKIMEENRARHLRMCFLCRWAERLH